MHISEEPKVYISNPDDPNSHITHVNYSNLRAIGRLGYRFQKPEGGFFFRVAYTPNTFVWSAIPGAERSLFRGIWHWFGISVGKSF